MIVKLRFTFGGKIHFSFILHHPNFQTALYELKLDLWVSGFLLLELVCVLSEMDVSEEARQDQSLQRAAFSLSYHCLVFLRN